MQPQETWWFDALFICRLSDGLLQNPARVAVPAPEAVQDERVKSCRASRSMTNEEIRMTNEGLKSEGLNAP